jgi:hypothetical protein
MVQKNRDDLHNADREELLLMLLEVLATVCYEVKIDALYLRSYLRKNLAYLLKSRYEPLRATFEMEIQILLDRCASLNVRKIVKSKNTKKSSKPSKMSIFRPPSTRNFN